MLVCVLGPGYIGSPTALQFAKSGFDVCGVALNEEFDLKFIRSAAENEGYQVKCYDPHVPAFDCPLYGLDESVRTTDCIIKMADHDCFRSIEPENLPVRSKFIIDTRHLLDAKKWRNAGYTVKILGNGTNPCNSEGGQ